MTKLQIRPVLEADLEAVSQLIEDAAAAGMYTDFSEAGIVEFRRVITPDSIRQRLSENYLYLIAESGGQPAGMIAMRELRHLYHLFVAPQFRRAGVAAALWAEALEYCRSADPDLSGITVYASPFALGVYQKFGFQITGERQDENGIASIPMALRLKDVE